MDISRNNDVYDDLYVDGVYGELIDKYRIIFIDDFINWGIIKRSILQLYKYMEDDIDSPIHVMINSHGGELDPAFAFINEVRLCDCKIITYAVTYAESAAANIFLSGDLRIIYPNAIVMLHSVRSGKFGTVNNLYGYAEFLDRYNDMVKKYLKETTKLSDKEIDDILINDKETMFMANDAIKYGIADAVYTGRVIMPPRSTSLYNYNYAVVGEEEDNKLNKCYDVKDKYRQNILKEVNNVRQSSKTKKRNIKKKKTV